MRRRATSRAPSEPVPPPLDDAAARILAGAALASSGHNAQPWEVRSTDSRNLTLRCPRERWLPAVDPENREAFLSLGAFLENLCVAAEAEGLRADITGVATSTRDEQVAHVALRPGSRRDGLARLQGRCTLRQPFPRRELPAALVERLRLHDPELLYLPFPSAPARWLDEATVAANQTQASRDAAQEELVRWMRWKLDEVERHRDGLSLAQLGLGGLTGWVARTFLRKERLLTPSGRAQSVAMARKQVSGSGGWLVLTSTGNSPAELLDAGRRYQRLFNHVREEGVGLHPMSQALEEVPQRDEVRAALGLGTRVPQLLLRVGLPSSYPAPVSVRRPVPWFHRAA